MIGPSVRGGSLRMNHALLDVELMDGVQAEECGTVYVDGRQKIEEVT